MNYQQTLDYLYNTLPMFSRMGSAAYKKDLDNIRTLCQHLGNPQQQFKSIHVGGTNGKGSVSHMLAAIFQNSGYKTGLHTSPHLYDFRERIKLNGEMVPEAFVVDFVKQIRSLADEIQPSFFEISVAMAFRFFAEQQVDIAIIEVGLGGRLDSTNIITPELSVITNISWDHMNLLGNTLEEIAAEKAGIIKPNVPVIIGEALPETKPVFELVATAQNAALVFAENELEVVHHTLTVDQLQIDYKNSAGQILPVATDLTGIYQLQNVRTVLTAVAVLQQKGWKLSNLDETLQQVKSTTGLHGRWEVIARNPDVILEVAHNKNGMEQMLLHLQQLSYQKLHIVMGMVKDKELQPVLQLLPTDAAYYFTQAAIPRALEASALQMQARELGLQGEVFSNVNDALKTALAEASTYDVIVVCGSIFLVAEVDKESLPTIALHPNEAKHT